MQRTCPKCGGVTQGNVYVCVHCDTSLKYVLPEDSVEAVVPGTVVSPLSTSEETKAQQTAVASLILAVVSVFIAGPIFAIASLVVSKSVELKLPDGTKIKNRYGLVMAGRVVSVCVLLFWALIIGLVLFALIFDA